MTQSDIILQELLELKSGLGSISRQNIFGVPFGYFDDLAGEILKQVRALEAANAADELAALSPFLSSIPKQTPYSLPAGYFDTLEKKLDQPIIYDRDQTVEEELESISPLLSGLKKQKTYTVPVGYFENLQNRFGGGNTVPVVKVISITSRKWFRYAAAALVIGFVATIGFLILNKQDRIDPADKSFDWVRKHMKKVSTDEINEFVELANSGTTDAVKTNARDEINNLLKNVSDKEIQDFLNDTQAAESETDDDLILN